jgi:hypothetical protein
MMTVLAYFGLALLAASTLGLIRPSLLRVRWRRSALALIVPGLLLASAGAWWPVATRRSARGTLLDAAVPEFQFSEFHETLVRARPEEIHRAIRSVTPDEIRFLRSLTWIRSPRLPGWTTRETILAPSWHEPMLDVALRTGFVLLGETRGREVVVGTVVCCGAAPVRTAEDFRSRDRPGFARAAMSFGVEDLGGGLCRVTTETRVSARGAAARRRFGLYWSFIYPGSSLIRYGWLEAIRRRAESPPRLGGRPAPPSAVALSFAAPAGLVSRIRIHVAFGAHKTSVTTH